MFGVFGGLEVLDLSSGIAGPMSTMLLSDNGATVTKVEHPSGDRFSSQTGYRVWNRGKRRVRVDLADKGDLDGFWKLLDRTDVLVESFSPGTVQRLGIDPERLMARNPRLVVCSITGYGRHGKLKDRPGYDGLVSARTGLLFDQKGRNGTPMEYILGRPGPCQEIGLPEGLRRGADRSGPVFSRTPWPSIGATYLAALGVAAALRAREITGTGQHVETSLLQGALAAVCLNWQRVERPDSPLYWMWPTDGRSIEGLFECADGRWVHHWTIRPNWVLESANGTDKPTPPSLDGPYRDDPDRVSMDPEGLVTGYYLYDLLAEAFKKFPADEWVEAAEWSGMGMALVRSPAEALADSSFLADGCVAQVDDPEAGPIRFAGSLLEFSSAPGKIRGPSPVLASTADELLASMSVPAAQSVARCDTLSHPLSGIRVLDLGLGVAGPFAGRALSDLGADVIKVNALHDGYWNGTHMGLGTNRGKRSIALNLKEPASREVLERLIAKADVFTTNWRPGAAARLGVDYESLRSKYPSLVYCNTRGFEKGARSNLPGTDQTAAALTGTEWEDGGCDAGNPPMWSRSNMGDTGNALLAAIAITSALYYRDKTGKGQSVSTSIVNAGLLHTSYAWIHEDGRPSDWRHVDANQYGLSTFYRMYRCSDGEWIFVSATRPVEQAALLTVTGVVSEGVSEVCASSLEFSFAKRTATEWFESLDEARVPCEIADEQFCRRIFDDPEARDLNLVSQTESGAVGRFEDSGLLINFSKTPGTVQRGPCMCGEHTIEILLEHNFENQEIQDLVHANVVAVAPGTRGG